MDMIQIGIVIAIVVLLILLHKYLPSVISGNSRLKIQEIYPDPHLVPLYKQDKVDLNEGIINYSILSSRNSYLDNNKDCSLDALKQVLDYGAKFIELDLFTDDGTIVVAKDVHLEKRLDFKDCCNIIDNNAFKLHPHDPLFLYLKCKSLGPYEQNEIAKIIKQVIPSDHLLHKKYGNVGNTLANNDKESIYKMSHSIDEFKNRIIIVTDNPKPLNKDVPRSLDDITNLSTDDNYTIGINHIPTSENPEEVISTSDNKMSLYYPNDDFAWIGVSGTQFIPMKFYEKTEALDAYLKIFSIDNRSAPNRSYMTIKKKS